MPTTTTLSKPLADELVELVAARFRVIGEPMRIRLLERLRDGERSVQELADELGANQQNISKHLAVLHGAGILARRRAGTRVLYAIDDPSVFDLCESVCGGIQRQARELDRRLSGLLS